MLTTFYTNPYRTIEERQTIIHLPKIERQDLIEKLLVTYPTFDSIVRFIRKFHYPAGDDAAPGTGAIGGLLGKTGVGKSDICKFYCNDWPPILTADGLQFPVVYINATEKMTPTSLCEDVFTSTGSQSKPGQMKASAFIKRAVERLVKFGCRFLIIDDAQFLFCDRNRIQAGLFYSFLKQVVDTEEINILLVGDDPVEDFMVANPALHRRGDFPKMRFSSLKDEGDEFEQFQLLLRKVDNRLPFAEPSLLDSKEYAEDFHLFSGGALGRVMNVIRYAGYQALDEDSSHITREHLMAQANLRRRPRDTYEYFARIPTLTTRSRATRASSKGAKG
jgi:hypothetical protein